MQYMQKNNRRRKIIFRRSWKGRSAERLHTYREIFVIIRNVFFKNTQTSCANFATISPFVDRTCVKNVPQLFLSAKNTIDTLKGTWYAIIVVDGASTISSILTITTKNWIYLFVVNVVILKDLFVVTTGPWS